MRKFWKNLATAVVCSLSLATSVFGQSAGDEVVVITEKAEIKNEHTIVETASRGDYYKVRAVNGNWLSVNHCGTIGWLNRDKVVLQSRAIEHFTNELRRNPKDEDALIARAIAWGRLEEFTNGIRDCTDAVAINPDWYWGYLIRGQIWLARKDFDLALADFNESVRLQPSSSGCFYNRGLYFYQRGNFEREAKHYEQAISDFTEAIRLNPKDARHFDGRGDSYFKLKRLDKALADFTMAIELDSKDAGVLGRRARLYHGQQLFAKALNDREAAVEADPKSAWAANALAWQLATCPDEKVRNGHRAIQFAMSAIELATDTKKKAAYRDSLAAAYAEIGDFTRAVEVQQSVLAEIDSKLKSEVEERLKLYQASQPYRDHPKPELTTTTAAK